MLFSGFTVLNGFATSPTTFGICRFIAGLGIGGVMPNVVALMNEYAPKKIRSTLVAIMFSGYSVGGMLLGGPGDRADSKLRLAGGVLCGGAAFAAVAADHVLPA